MSFCVLGRDVRRSPGRAGRRSSRWSRTLASSWLRLAVRSASAAVSSANWLLGFGERRLGFADALVDAGALLDARLDLGLQLGVSRRRGARARRRRPWSAAARAMSSSNWTSRRSSSAMRSLARVFLAVERLAGDWSGAARPAAARASASRSAGSRRRASAWMRAASACVAGCARPPRAPRDRGVGSASVTSALRADPAQMEQRRFRLADLGRDTRDSGPPGGPGASGLRSGRRAGRSRPRAA